MAIYTVGQFAYSANGNHRGQSFKPNDQGPDGTGTYSSEDPVYLVDVTLGYPNGTTTGRATYAHIYDALPANSNDPNSGTGKLFSSTGSSDGNVFSTGTNYSRTWSFNGQQLDPTKTYYILLSANQNIRYKTGNTYTSGSVITTNLGTNNNDAQFQVNLSTSQINLRTSVRAGKQLPRKKKKTNPTKKPIKKSKPKKTTKK